MKFLAFIFLFSIFSVFAEPAFYEGFSNTKLDKIITKHRMTPSIPLRNVGLNYKNFAVLKTTGDALKIMDGKFTTINFKKHETGKLNENPQSIWVSFLVKMAGIYDKNYSASFTLCGETKTNSIIIDLHRKPEKDLLINPSYLSIASNTNFIQKNPGFDLNKFKKGYIKDITDFNKKIIHKETILVVINIKSDPLSKKTKIFFNPKLDDISSNHYNAECILEKNLNKIEKYHAVSLSAKGADVIFDEIRCGTTADDVLPVEERKELTEEELLGTVADSNTVESADIKPDTFIVSNSFMESIVIIKGGKSVGTGFVAKSGTNKYIYTNVHVLMGNNKMRFTNKDGKKIKPLSIETTPGRDIVRLKIKGGNINALNIAKPPANNTPIAVCGNSGGSGVIRTLYGKVLGVGPEKVETNAKFISGNSGSPILLENGDAIGIAAYVQQANVNWVNTNTPFTVTRRFAYRIDNIEKWKKISPRTFVKEADILMKRDEKLEALISVLNTWANNPYWNRIQINDELPRAMTLWIDNQNEWVEHNHMRLKNTRGREANAKNLSRELIKELDDNVEFLKKSFKRSCIAKKRRWTVPFFKDYSDDMDRLQNILVEAIDHIAEAAAATDPVYLKKR